MAQYPVFKSVRLPHNDKNNEGTTQLINLRSENLFEVYNAAEIYDELLSNPTNSLSFNSSKVTVKSVILDDACFVCIDRTVHCFKIGSRADDSAVFELDAPPADICVVPGHKIILFLLQNGCICFFIPELSKLTSSKQIFNTPANTFKVAFGGFGPFLCLAVLALYEKQSEVKFVKFPPFEQLEHGSGAFFESTKLMKSTQNMNRCFVAGDKFGFAFFPQCKNNPILKQSAYSLHIENMSSAPLIETYNLPYGVQSVHQIGKFDWSFD
ncbi:hypothetical protein M3Y97_00045100 [Aphelenchoides bicaudatus]|nr:hypothetical protein M3Y97_00045100 [Aphelenchoides bicaudatus]